MKDFDAIELNDADLESVAAGKVDIDHVRFRLKDPGGTGSAR